MGFCDAHSSLVINVHHMLTGYVSLQFFALTMIPCLMRFVLNALDLLEFLPP